MSGEGPREASLGNVYQTLKKKTFYCIVRYFTLILLLKDKLCWEQKMFPERFPVVLLEY